MARSASAESPLRKCRQADTTEAATCFCKSDEAGDALPPRTSKARSSWSPNCAETDPFHSSVKLERSLLKMENKLSEQLQKPDFTGANRSFNPWFSQR